MNKRGVSQVIATILLIAIVIVLASSVFIWAQGFIAEGVAKGGGPVERSCEEVKFDTSVISRDTTPEVAGGDVFYLGINNQGNIPVYDFEVKVLGEGEVKVSKVRSEGSQGANVGESVEIPLERGNFEGLYGGTNNELIVIPILLGTKGDNRVPYPCPEEYGQGISVV